MHLKKMNTEDVTLINFKNGWVHPHKSNTKPIIRIYAESNPPEAAVNLAKSIIDHLSGMTKI